jgi:hypothetical protein
LNTWKIVWRERERREREKEREGKREHPGVLFEIPLHNILAALCTLGVTCSFDMVNSSFDVVDAGYFVLPY